MQELFHIFVDLSLEMSIIPPSIFRGFGCGKIVGSNEAFLRDLWG